MTHGGFRLDGDLSLHNSWTVQGNAHFSDEEQLVSPYWTEESIAPLTVEDNVESRGYNFLASWQHKYNDTSNWTLQTFFDYVERKEITLDQNHKTFDIDFQHRFQPGWRQDIVWGLGYRRVNDDFDNTYGVSFDPSNRTEETFSTFIQDEITIVKDLLWLTLGSKAERNDYTDVEFQPSARLLWRPGTNHSVWFAVSRALRIPSRVEDSSQVITQKLPIYVPPPIDTTLVVPLYINGNNTLEAEEAVAYEVGYRYSTEKNFSAELSLFHIVYSELIGYNLTFLPSGIPNLSFINIMDGYTRGLELTLNWQPTSWVKSTLNYSYIDIKLNTPGGAAGVDQLNAIEESCPESILSLHTTLALHKDLKLNLIGRYTDKIKTESTTTATYSQQVDRFLSMDANLRWTVNNNLEFMLAGQNLLDPHHLEYSSEFLTQPTEIGRSVYAKLTWTF